MRNLSMIPLSAEMSIYSYCLSLRGVRAVTWWDDPERGTMVIVLAHSWWTWRGFRDRNRRRVLVKAVQQHASWQCVEVI